MVVEAASGREALEQSSALKAELVILDMSIPELNGPYLGILMAVPDAPILILTRHDSEQWFPLFYRPARKDNLVKI